jgi:hypothetical protein
MFIHSSLSKSKTFRYRGILYFNLGGLSIVNVIIRIQVFTRLRQDAPWGGTGGMARGDRDAASRAKSGGFGAVSLGFAMGGPRGGAGSSAVILSPHNY